MSGFESQWLPPDITALIEQGKNDAWPPADLYGLYGGLFSSLTVAVDSVNTGSVFTGIQTAELITYYRDMTARSPDAIMPATQLDAVAAIRDAYRTDVAPTMPGTHYVTDATIGLLPDGLRTNVLQHWVSLNEDAEPDTAVPLSKVQLLVPDRGVRVPVAGSATLVMMHNFVTDLPAVWGVAPDLAKEDGETVLVRAERDTMQYWEPNTFEAEETWNHFRSLGTAALSIDESSAAFRAAM